MKKLLLSLAVVAAGSCMATAQEVTFDFAATNISKNADESGKIRLNGTVTSSNNIQPLESAVYQDITITFDNGGNSTKPAWYTTKVGTHEGDIRLYAKNSMTFTAPSGQHIEKIVFTMSSGQGSTTYNNFTVTSGTVDPVVSADNPPTNGMTVTWTKTTDVNEVTLSVPADKGAYTGAKNPQFRFITAVVTLANGGGGPVAPSAPEINGPATFYGANATITMTGATGADIYYTMSTNGEPADPTTSSLKYEGEIVINATTTFKAIAVKEGLSSTIATATFTKGTAMNVASIAEFLEQNNDEVCTFTSPVTVVGLYQKRYLFVQDATGYLQIFDGSNSLDRPYEMGQTISGFTVKRGAYNGTPQGNAADFASTFPATATGNTRDVLPFEIAATENDVKSNMNRLVYFRNVTITKNGNNYYVGAEGEFKGVQLYDRFGLKLVNDDLVGQNKDIEGYAVMFNTTPELFLTKVAAPNTILSVEGIDNSETPIYGAEGYVVAPAEAVIYNMGGMRVANANLAKGIYLVRCNGKTVKVAVK